MVEIKKRNSEFRLEMLRNKLNIEVKESSFHPNADVDEKSNCKTFYLVERDGTIFERIFLDLPNASLREEVIVKHYLSHFVRIFIRERVTVKILSRDDPWDFGLELSTKANFNVEITSIADDQDIFEKFKREERLLIATFKKEITVRELEKLAYFFPDTELMQCVEKVTSLGRSKTDSVPNPLYGRHQHLFLSRRVYDKEPLENIIQKSIEKKERKRHTDKEKTVLIIDNRTLMYELSDLEVALASLEKMLIRSPFKEIWFYTGYYSELDGSNAEYSFAPLKISSGQELTWNKFINTTTTTVKGISNISY